MKLLYFAWVRERVGKAEEQIDPPAAGDDMIGGVHDQRAACQDAPLQYEIRDHATDPLLAGKIGRGKERAAELYA